MSPDFVSIDQNSQPLWDVIPKLQALARRGWHGVHAVEDIDVAFTRRGAAPGDRRLAMVRERVYRGGVSDWGAALFYTEFLGRNPIDVRELEPYTGWTTAALSRRLDLSVDELYDRYSVSDNWQLVGSSYAEDGVSHRVIGDLRVAEAAPFLEELLTRAEANLLATFPESGAQARVRAWCATERGRLAALLAEHRGGSLADLYRGWVRQRVPDSVTVRFTSDLLALGDAADPRLGLLARFLDDYAVLAGHYNEAIRESGVGVSPLRTSQGELPFFLVWRRGERLLRTEAALQDGELRSGERAWPLRPGGFGELVEALRRDGVVCLAGKALVLVLQARLEATGAPLALPYQGSLYMPAAYAFERRLRAAGLLPGPLHPVLRVRFRFLDHWRGVATRVRVPEYLRSTLGIDEQPAADLAAGIAQARDRAAAFLAALRSPQTRDAALDAAFPAFRSRWRELDAHRRDLARDPARRGEAGAVWDQVKALERDLLAQLTAAVVTALHVRGLDYWDSRGALEPWAVALGGPELADRLVAAAEVYHEP